MLNALCENLMKHNYIIKKFNLVILNLYSHIPSKSEFPLSFIFNICLFFILFLIFKMINH